MLLYLWVQFISDDFSFYLVMVHQLVCNVVNWLTNAMTGLQV